MKVGQGQNWGCSAKGGGGKSEYRPVSGKVYRLMIRIFIKLRHVGLWLRCWQIWEGFSVENVINLLRKRQDKVQLTFKP
jgi:hypothetical protein